MSEILMTRGRREALVHLSEECAEVIVAISKTLRHGFDSFHPDNPGGPTNLEAIADELGDVLAGVDILLANMAGTRSQESVRWFRARMRGQRHVKLLNVERYLHHALVPAPNESEDEWGVYDGREREPGRE